MVSITHFSINQKGETFITQSQFTGQLVLTRYPIFIVIPLIKLFLIIKELTICDDDAIEKFKTKQICFVYIYPWPYLQSRMNVLFVYCIIKFWMTNQVYSLINTALGYFIDSFKLDFLASVMIYFNISTKLYNYKKKTNSQTFVS